LLLNVQHISKSFQNNLALQDVSLSIEKNKIYGLLGPNGAGKTTLIRNITQIFFSDTGEIFFNNEKLSEKHQNQIGYMPEERGLYKKMKVGEQLMYFARLRDFTKIDAEQKIDYWLNKLDIQNWRNKTIEELSKGMQQKVQFVATVLHEPTLLILDEPFSGLDPINAEIIKNEIFELQQKGTTIIFSTHRMENVEEICEDIFLINNGKIILEGNVQNIKQQYKKHLIKVDMRSASLNEASRSITESSASLNEASNKKISSDIDIIEQTNSHLIIKQKENQTINDLLKILITNNIEIQGMTEILPSINEIFIQTVKNES
jgi:ABC-2 type transport system ATP-binding protein